MFNHLYTTLHNIKTYALSFCILLSVVGCSNSITHSSSDELHVITSGGFATAYQLLAPEFEQKTGIKLITSFGSSSGGAPDSIPVRLGKGQEFDVIILSQKSLNNLTKLGYVIPKSRADLVQSSIGMAVKEGAEIPDISTNESFIATLLKAKSIGYSASASGTYLSNKLWPKLNIWEDIKGKSTRILSERVATVVARGDVEIGFQQVSEILPIHGAQFVSPIPADFQKITTFSTGILKNARNIKGAERLISFLSSKGVKAVIKAQGLEPVLHEHD